MSLRAQKRSVLTVLLPALAALFILLAGPASAFGSQPLTFSAPTPIDSQTPFTTTVPITSVSCPSTALCVAG